MTEFGSGQISGPHGPQFVGYGDPLPRERASLSATMIFAAAVSVAALLLAAAL